MSRRVAARAGSRPPGCAGPPGRSRRRTPSAHASAPAGLWAPSTMTSGWWPRTSKRPGHHARSAKPSRHDVARERRVEERLDRGEGDGGVVALVAAVERQEHVGVDRRRRPEVEQPAAERRAGSRRTSKSLAAHRAPRLPALGPEDLDADRDRSRRSPRRDPGLTMPAFSRAMSASVGPANSVWSRPTLVTTATCASHHVRGVPATEQPDLDDGDVDRGVGEPAERRRGDDLEVARAHAGDQPRGRRSRRPARRSRRRRSARRRGRCAR